MAWVMVGVAVVGTVITVIGNEEEADARQRQANESARFKELQADEVLRRLDINKDSAEEQAAQVSEYITSRAGASGFGSSSTVGLLADTENALRKQISNLSRESEFNAFILRSEASAQRRLGREIQSSVALQNTSTILGGVSSVASATSTKSSSTPLNNSSTSLNSQRVKVTQ